LNPGRKRSGRKKESAGNLGENGKVAHRRSGGPDLKVSIGKKGGRCGMDPNSPISGRYIGF